MIISNEKYIPKDGDSIQGDEWKQFQTIYKDSGFKDNSYKGCQFRYNTFDYKIGINIFVTGKPHFLSDRMLKSRIKIEVVGDGEPSTFFSGWIFHTNN